MAQMAEAAMMGGAGVGDTFLTDMLLTGKDSRAQQRKGSNAAGKRQGKATFQSAMKPSMRSGSQNAGRLTPSKQASGRHGATIDQESEALSDLEDEYRDVVFDVE